LISPAHLSRILQTGSVDHRHTDPAHLAEYLCETTISVCCR